MSARIIIPFSTPDVLCTVWELHLSRGRLFVPTHESLRCGATVLLGVDVAGSPGPLTIQGLAGMPRTVDGRLGLDLHFVLEDRHWSAMEAYITGFWEEALVLGDSSEESSWWRKLVIDDDAARFLAREETSSGEFELEPPPQSEDAESFPRQKTRPVPSRPVGRVFDDLLGPRRGAHNRKTVEAPNLKVTTRHQAEADASEPEIDIDSIEFADPVATAPAENEQLDEAFIEIIHAHAVMEAKESLAKADRGTSSRNLQTQRGSVPSSGSMGAGRRKPARQSGPISRSVRLESQGPLKPARKSGPVSRSVREITARGPSSRSLADLQERTRAGTVKQMAGNAKTGSGAPAPPASRVVRRPGAPPPPRSRAIRGRVPQKPVGSSKVHDE